MTPTPAKTRRARGVLEPLAPAEPMRVPSDGRRARGVASRVSILDEAVQLASTDGLEGLTLSMLADRLRVPKSSVHAAFGSKQDLQVAILRESREILIQQVIKPALASPAGYPRLLTLGTSWIGYLERGVFQGGCVLSSAASELDGRPGPARDTLVEIMTEWLTFLSDNVRIAIEKGDLSGSADPQMMAFQLHGIGLTANWHHQLFGGKAALSTARTSWVDALDRHRKKESRRKVR